MASYQIPSNLIELIQERRVIPFIGSGFSAVLNLPQWDELLRRIAEDIDDSLTYEDIKKFCNDDFLQIAEYLFLKADKNIGPLRHRISIEIQSGVDPIFSGAHVELVNLGAPQIYTTNYDDLIERTFHNLGVPHNIVALPKHVASADNKKTQIVKFHGDLRHEMTLVLTESSYYTRLDFESPMDLKFRSDLLGKSVLFMGYSFRDINIRIIWFKLMQMMKDIPQADRPLSYIVRFEPNPCLDMLYESVGLRTIVLDPKAQADTESKKQSLFAEFLTDLGINVSPDAQIPGHARPLFVSASFLEMLTNRLDALVKARRELFGFPSREVHLVKHLGLRQINELLAPSVKDILLRLGRFRLISYVSTCAANYAKSFGAAPGVTLITAMSLTNNQGRSELFGIPKYPWAVAWNSQLSADDANAIIKVFKRETANHKDGPGPDNDLAWTTDPVARIANGEIASASNVAVVDAATKALAEASIIYPSIARYKPPKSAAPAVEDIIKEIQERTAQATDEPSTDFKDEDIPF